MCAASVSVDRYVRLIVEARNPLELELKVVVNYLMWVLGTALCSSVLLTAEPSYPVCSKPL